MKLTEQKKIKHVSQAIAAGFIGSFIAFCASLFFPPDFTTMPPTYPLPSIIFGEISLALLIFGCTVLGVKLAEEKKTLPAAGFTMLAIAMGLYFVLYFINTSKVENLEDGYKTFCGFIYLLLPAMILIAFYSNFPRWVNVLGVASCIPNIIVYVLFMRTQKYFVELDYISFISIILQNITALIWGILILRNARVERKNVADV